MSASFRMLRTERVVRAEFGDQSRPGVMEMSMHRADSNSKGSCDLLGLHAFLPAHHGRQVLSRRHTLNHQPALLQGYPKKGVSVSSWFEKLVKLAYRALLALFHRVTAENGDGKITHS